MKGYEIILSTWTVGNLITQFQVKSILEEEIVKMQPLDPALRKLAKEVRCKRWSYYVFRNDGKLIKEGDYAFQIIRH